jgi:hypothetical protein
MTGWFPLTSKHSRFAELLISLLFSLALASLLSSALHAQGPALTTVSDTVYRADGSAAAGTVLISWPTFQTLEGDPVAAGNLAVTLGPSGSYRTTGSQRWRISRGHSLRRRFSIGRWNRPDGILVGACHIANDNCGSAGDTG